MLLLLPDFKDNSYPNVVLLFKCYSFKLIVMIHVLIPSYYLIAICKGVLFEMIHFRTTMGTLFHRNVMLGTFSV